MSLIHFEAKMYIFLKYFLNFFEILLRLDGGVKKACPATSCGPCRLFFYRSKVELHIEKYKSLLAFWVAVKLLI